MTNEGPTASIPLCIDLDGTLIVGDSLRQAALHLLTRRPWTLPGCALALASGGRTAFKEALGRAYVPDPTRLPWRPAVLAYLEEQVRVGRRLILATAAPHRFAEVVARHLGLFESFIASNATRNIKGSHKVRAIHEHLGTGPFDYAGDSWTDLPVFAAARRSIVVSRDQRLVERVRSVGQVEIVFAE